MLSGAISLLSPAYLLSVDRWPFHLEPPGHYGRLSSLLDLWVFAVRQACAIALQQTVPNRFELTFARLRYCLGGDRPSQTSHLAGFRNEIGLFQLERIGKQERCFIVGSPSAGTEGLSPAAYATHVFDIFQRKVVVKVHGVFPSSREDPASSRGIQFRWACAGDSGEVVTPFVQVGTYPTRNFATFGPL